VKEAKSNSNISERGKINTTNTLIHDHSLSWIGTVTSIKSGGVELVYWPTHPLLVKKIFGHASAFHMRIK
jgi:hypothetical protein